MSMFLIFTPLVKGILIYPFDWQSTTISDDVAKEAINFIRNAISRGDVGDLSNRTFVSPDSLAEKQRLAFEIVLRHSAEYEILSLIHI